MLQLFSSERTAQVIMETLATNVGPGQARNVGFGLARALGVDVLCCTDSDCLPADNWVECMVEAQAQKPGLVYGNTSSHQPDTLTGDRYSHPARLFHLRVTI